MTHIVVLDYGSGNLRSVVKALETVSEKPDSVEASQRASTILAADRVVFPGQGAMGQCMGRLRDQELDGVIRECIETKPFLGICLGLQSLLESSEEDGGVAGLGVLPGRVKRFQPDVRDERGALYKIPSMGWNQVYQRQSHPLWKGIEDGSRFYFVHSYYAEPERPEDIAGETDYIGRYTSAVARDNFFATQFHPEKSQHDGLRLLKNFVNWTV